MFCRTQFPALMPPNIADLRALLPTIDGVKAHWIKIGTIAIMSVPVIGLAIAVLLSSRTTTAPQHPSEFWTLVQAVASVGTLAVSLGVGVIAWYGLRSIRFARQDMVTRATREARTLAIARGEQFAGFIRGPHSEILGELAAAKVPSFTLQVGSAAATLFDNEDLYPQARTWWTSVPPTTQNRILYFLNDLEAWAMYFTHELAEATVVSVPCGVTYCGMVVQYAPWIIVARKEQFKGFYPNVLTIFRAWRSELDAKAESSQIEAVLRAAQSAEQRRALHKLPTPLGTDVVD
jgi:hypothetical protein